MKTNRAKSVTEILQKKRNVLSFEDKFKDSFGQPELASVWLIWGSSGSGKTSLALEIARYLCELGLRVGYNSLEQGDSLSMANAIERARLEEQKRKFILLDREPIANTIIRYKKHKSPDVLLIDSIQYSRLKYSEYIDMKSELHGKMIIIISQSRGEEPKGSTADGIRFDADVKIHCKGYKAFPMSRFGGEAEFIIYPQGALEYWGFKEKTQNN